MAAPTLKVEIAFGDATNRAWVDVTSDVLQPDRVAWQRGASAARAQVDTGSLSLSLRNDDRAYDPLHTSGPYYGYLTPGTPVRVAQSSPVAGSNVLSGSSTSDGASFVTGTLALTAGRLYLLAVSGRAATETTNAMTATQTGATWTKAFTQLYGPSPTYYGRMTVFRCQPAANVSAAAITLGFGESQTSCIWSVTEFTGCFDDSAGNGERALGPLIDGSSQIVNFSSATTLEVSIPPALLDAGVVLTRTSDVALSSSDSAVFAVVTQDVNQTSTVAAPFTELSDQGVATNAQAQVSAIGLGTGTTFPTSPIETASFSWAAASAGVAFAVEVRPASGLFTGAIPAWPQQFDLSNRWATVPVVAYDFMDRLNRSTVPRTPIAGAIDVINFDLSGFASCLGYWPLTDDQNGGWQVTDYMGQNIGTASGEPTFGSNELIPGLGPSILFDGTDDQILLSRSPIRPYEGEGLAGRGTPYFDMAPDVTIGVVFRTSTAAATGKGRILFAQEVGSPGALTFGFALYVDENGYLVFQIHAPEESGWDPGYTERAFISDVIVADGQTHVAFAEWSINNTQRGVSIDGGAFCTDSTTFLDVPGNGTGIGGLGAPAGWNFAGNIQHVALWDWRLDEGTAPDVIPDQRLTDAYACYTGQTSDERVSYILDQIIWPTSQRHLEVGDTFLGPVVVKAGDNVLNYLRLVNQTEDGRLFISGDGWVWLTNRGFPFTDASATVSQFTFTDAASTGYAEFEITSDDVLLCNSASVTRRDGLPQVARDQDFIDLYGEVRVELSDLLHQTDNQSKSLAEWLVASRKTPQPRVTRIRVPLHRYSAADQTSVLSLEIGNRVTVVRTPQGVGSAISLPMLIDGIRQEVGSGEWWWEAVVSPVPQANLTLFTWGTSNWDGTHVWAY